jgi:hypothetical protein
MARNEKELVCIVETIVPFKASLPVPIEIVVLF